MKTIFINYGEYEYTNFNKAIKVLEEEYGYEGLAWEMVKASNDMEILAEFLEQDGISAEVEED